MWASEKTQEHKDKEAFALELLKQTEPFKAAIAVFGQGEVGKCLKLSMEWPADPYVMAHKKYLLDTQGAESFLPTKADIAKKILTIHDEARSSEDKIKALKLYADVLGFIVKPETDGKNKTGGVIAVAMTPVEQNL